MIKDRYKKDCITFFRNKERKEIVLKKSLLTLALVGALGFVGSASAQSQVVLYGNVDAGIVKKSGHNVGMNQDVNTNNVIGIRGVEPISENTSAIFKVEKRFHLNDGTEDNEGKESRDLSGQAYVGLKNNYVGTLRLGRINEISNENWRKYDLHNNYGVASALTPINYTQRVDNTVRYDSPEFGGINLTASYSFGENIDKESRNARGDMIKKAGYDNDGWGVGGTGHWGWFDMTANYSRIADSNKSDIWNAAVGATFGDWRINVGYQKAENAAMYQGEWMDWSGNNDTYGDAENIKTEQWLAGVAWNINERNRLSLQGNFMTVKSSGISDSDVRKYSIGYDHYLSKRTALYAQYAYTKYDDEDTARLFSDARESSSAWMVGMTHKF